MKIAIIQEWLVTVGGSDKVVKAIADVFPDADIYTLVAKKQVCDELGIDWNKVHTSFIQKLPLGVKKHRMYLPIYGAQNEAYNVERGRKTPKVVYLQRVARVEAVRSAQNEMFT